MLDPDKKEVLGLHDSLSAVADGPSAQMETRAKEISLVLQKLRTWFKNELTLRNIWETMIEGIDKFPRINMPDMSLPLGKDDTGKSKR